MTRGKIVLLPFPFDTLSTTKVRPALCLTDPISQYSHVVVAFISSRIPTVLLPTDMLLDSGHKDFTATGLRVTSVLRLHRLITVNTSIIRRLLGKLPPQMDNNVAAKLKILFALR